MTGIITLDDGIDFVASNIAISSIYQEISQRIPNTHLRLKKWLYDLSGRCAPFFDFNILGLELEDRIALISAIKKTKQEIEPNSNLFVYFQELVELIDRATKEYPGYPNRPTAEFKEDLDELWEVEDIDVESSMNKLCEEVNSGKVRMVSWSSYERGLKKYDE